jgi:hypothetical protein
MAAPENPGNHSEDGCKHSHDNPGPSARAGTATFGIRGQRRCRYELVVRRRLTANPMDLLGVASGGVNFVFGVRAHGNSFDSGSLPGAITVELEALRRKKV